MKNIPQTFFLLSFCLFTWLYGQKSFSAIQMSDAFYAEGVASGDLNKDGRNDVVAGPFWYEGPDFIIQHSYYKAPAPFNTKGENYADAFYHYVYDFNGDSWPDIMEILTPGQGAYWYENNQGGTEMWKKHLAFAKVDNESPLLTDMDGDSLPELLMNYNGYIGWASPQWNTPESKWVFSSISPKGNWHKYTHGLGAGDVNGDGRVDILMMDGWWEQPETIGTGIIWQEHAAKFWGRDEPGEPVGGAQMFVYDVDGDEDGDIITSLQSHGWGISWFENTSANGQSFTEHKILGTRKDEQFFGAAFGQPHALALGDINGDGLKDLVSGKRKGTHGSEPNAAPVLYWFELIRDSTLGAVYKPHLIDDASGVGMQVGLADLNGDKAPDIYTSVRLGTFVFLNEVNQVTRVQRAPSPSNKSLGIDINRGVFINLNGRVYDVKGKREEILRRSSEVLKF